MFSILLCQQFLALTISTPTMDIPFDEGGDIRIVRGTVLFTFQRLGQMQNEVWIVAEVLPMAGTTGGAIPTQILDEKSGKLIVPKDNSIILVEGTIKVNHTLVGQLPIATWTYKWQTTSSHDFKKQRLDETAIFEFCGPQHPHTMICSINE